MSPSVARLPATRIAERRSERLIEELLEAQGWDIRRPPAGELLTQQEYRDFIALREALDTASKTGARHGVPEFVLVARKSGDPLAVFEAKAKASAISEAVAEATRYGEALFAAGFSPLAVAVAGTRDDTFDVRVLKRRTSGWEPVTYEGHPITWIPSRDQLARARAARTSVDLRPTIPPPEVLKDKAEEINGLLREAGLKDDFRPAAIGAIMLALWKSEGALRRDPRFILADVNQACQQAFWDAKKPDLAKSLHVDEANEKLAVRTLRISQILERLNITNLTAEHDYLGALYEEFFRYTGGNTIGQYFTPRHITRLMADLADVGKNDVVLDPACGTGGFLIAAMQRMQQQSKLSRDQIVKLVQTQLIGLEDEPVTAALCVANMILRGDGSSSVRRADCFDDSKFPFDSATVVLMNPPFPHKKTDTPPEQFIDRALAGLKHRGRAAIVVPSSLLGAGPKAAWRRAVLKENSLLAVITLPTELFQPYAAANTAVLIMERGLPHTSERRVSFCRVTNDGLRLRKGVRLPRDGSQLPKVIAVVRHLLDQPGFSAAAPIESDDWAPGAYIEAKPLTVEEFRNGVEALLRDKTAFVTRYAPQLAASRDAIRRGDLPVVPYKRRGKQPVRQDVTGTVIGDLFFIYYGYNELESKAELGPGDTPVVSSAASDNGIYGFFDFPEMMEPPFVTVPRTGSYGEARVQEYPVAASSDCLVLMPKPDTPVAALYVAAATIRDEKWRFDYSRKLTPTRIASLPLRMDEDLLAWVEERRAVATAVEMHALEAFTPVAAVSRDDRIKIEADPEDALRALLTTPPLRMRRLMVADEARLDSRREREADRDYAEGRFKTFENVEDLFADLDADD